MPMPQPHMPDLLRPLTLAVFALLALACTSVVDSDMRDAEALRAGATWTFLANEPALDPAVADAQELASYRVRTPTRDPVEIDRAIQVAIERELASRGYRRVERDAEVYVNYHLVLEPRVDSIEVPLASKTVRSYSDQPTYTVEGTTVESRVSEELHLDVEIRSQAGRILWRGELEGRYAPMRELPIDSSIHRILAPIEAREDS